MRTCVNLLSAEIKFAAGTASFLREGLGFPHKKSLSRNCTHAASALEELSLGYAVFKSDWPLREHSTPEPLAHTNKSLAQISKVGDGISATKREHPH